MIPQLKIKSNEVRRQVLENCYLYKNSHLSSCLSAVDIISTLYFGGFIRERVGKFILSKGHANETLSTILEMMGVQGVKHSDHPEFGNPGIETTTGSLGQGLGIACGMALSNKIDGSNEMIYVLCGDGELMEGLCYEALNAIFDLDLPIKILIDRNYYCTEREPYSFSLRTVTNRTFKGHNIEEIYKSLKNNDKVIVYETIKGYGLHHIHDKEVIDWNMIHYLTANNSNIEEFRKELTNSV